MKNMTLPGYEDYRAEADLIVPQASRLIAIRRHMTAQHPELLLQDMKEQLPADVFETFWPKLKERWVDELRSRDYRKLMAFCLLKPDGVKPFAYISTPDVTLGMHKIMSIYAGGMPSFRMKFTMAANRPEVAAWCMFFHELAHGLINARSVSYQQDHFYYLALEETVCDSFATLHALRKFGADAIPFLQTIADMRLSTFSFAGDRYFTGPAIKAVVDAYKSGQLNISAGLEEDGGFALARHYAEQNFLDAGDVASFHYRCRNMSFLDLFIGSYPYILRECFTMTGEEGQATLMGARTQSREWQKELHERSQMVETDYTYPTRRMALAARIRERLAIGPQVRSPSV